MADPSKQPKRKRENLADLVSQPGIRPTFGAILDHFFAIVGGPEKFAKMLHDDYQAAPPGSMTRGKIIDILAKGLKDQDAKAGLGDDLGLLTDEDIQREMARRELALAPYVEMSLGKASQHPTGPDAAKLPTPERPELAAAPAADATPPAPAAGPGRPPA